MYCRTRVEFPIALYTAPWKTLATQFITYPTRNSVQSNGTSTDLQQSQATKFASERDELWKQMNTAHIDFVRYLLGEMRAAANQYVKAMVEIRNELGLDSNIEEFTKQMEKQRDRMTEQLDAFFRDLSKES